MSTALESDDQKNSPVVGVVVGLIGALIGLLVLRVTIDGIGRWLLIEHGGATSARVVGYELTTRKGTTSNDRTFTAYVPTISYKYSVDGQRYSKNETLSSEFRDERGEAEKAFASRYGEDAEITIHYNPHAPGTATASSHHGPILLTLFGGAFGLLFLLIFGAPLLLAVIGGVRNRLRGGVGR